MHVIAVAVEIIGGVLLALGYKTRFTALVLAIFSVVTGVVFHNVIGDQNQFIHLMKNIAMAGGLIQIAAFGAGAFSIDHAAILVGQTLELFLRHIHNIEIKSLDNNQPWLL